MQTKEQLFTISKPRWQWHRVDSELRTSIDGKLASYSLRPNLSFQIKKQDGKLLKLRLKAFIDTQKSLQYQNQVGWNWHKSSNLPLISLKIELRNPQTDALFPLPENLYVRIQAVKAVSNILGREKVSYLQNVGLRGENEIEMKNGCAIFSGIKFLTTSYNNEGVKFHLLLTTFMKNPQNQNSQIKDIIFSAISSAIFVDSRKSARDYQQKRFLSFVEIFDPSLMNKEFSKKPFVLKGEFETKITNNMDGLFNYLTASNIHHKVKHPIFLSVKFSNVFHIMFNTKHSFFKSQGITITDTLIKLQKSLIKQFGQNQQKVRGNSKNGKLFVICVATSSEYSNYKKSKIWECLQFLDCKDIEFLKSIEQVKSYYKNITQLGDVGEAYDTNFELLTEITNKEMNYRKGKLNNESQDHQKQQNKIISAEPKKGEKERSSQNSVAIVDIVDLQKSYNTIKYRKSSNSQQHELKYQKQFKKLNIPFVLDYAQNYNKMALQQLQYRNMLQKNEMNSYLNYGSQSALNQFLQPNSLRFQNFQIQNQIDYAKYYQPLVNQIEYQNNMLAAIIKQNIMMRENLLTMMIQKQNITNVYEKRMLGNGYIEYSNAFLDNNNQLLRQKLQILPNSQPNYFNRAEVNQNVNIPTQVSNQQIVKYEAVTVKQSLCKFQA